MGAAGCRPASSPFNAFWRETVATVAICSGACLAIVDRLVHGPPGARRSRPACTSARIADLITGTLVWGARLGDFNTFHLFYGGMAVFATPAAAVAVWSVWRRLRATGRRRLAIALAVALRRSNSSSGRSSGSVGCGLFGPGRSRAGPDDDPGRDPGPARPTPSWPTPAGPLEEAAFWDSQLLGLDAHTGRRVVPMCFQAETAGLMTRDADLSRCPEPAVPMGSAARALSRLRARAVARERGRAFLKANGIDYIYVDAVHPNTLVPDAIPIATERRDAGASHPLTIGSRSVADGRRYSPADVF